MRLLFHSYIGAVYAQSGIAPIQEWMSRIIDPNYTYNTHSQPTRYSPPLASSSSSPAPQPSTAPPPAPLPIAYLPLVNQMSSQRFLPISYPAQSSGPSHQPTWTVRCISAFPKPNLTDTIINLCSVVNGEERGVGKGKNQKIAKEEAAKQAFLAMGWDPRALNFFIQRRCFLICLQAYRRNLWNRKCMIDLFSNVLIWVVNV